MSKIVALNINNKIYGSPMLFRWPTCVTVQTPISTVAVLSLKSDLKLLRFSQRFVSLIQLNYQYLLQYGFTRHRLSYLKINIKVNLLAFWIIQRKCDISYICILNNAFFVNNNVSKKLFSGSLESIHS